MLYSLNVFVLWLCHIWIDALLFEMSYYTINSYMRVTDLWLSTSIISHVFIALDDLLNLPIYITIFGVLYGNKRCFICTNMVTLLKVIIMKYLNLWLGLSGDLMVLNSCTIAFGLWHWCCCWLDGDRRP